MATSETALLMSINKISPQRPEKLIEFMRTQALLQRLYTVRFFETSVIDLTRHLAAIGNPFFIFEFFETL